MNVEVRDCRPRHICEVDARLTYTDSIHVVLVDEVGQLLHLDSACLFLAHPISLSQHESKATLLPFHAEVAKSRCQV